MSTPIFHRHALAEAIAKRTLSPKGQSGLFMSAPRRTGKSTLVNEDIIPALVKLDSEVIYVDLWSDRSRDPGDLISEAIREHLLKREGAILRWARKGGLDKITLAGVQLDISKVGIGSETTIAKALADLSDATKRMIVLVVDEAQHALTTEAGTATLFALKAARDQLNGSTHYGFRLIATGSNRDKLTTLVQGKDQAFMSAVLFDLDPLGDEYLDWELRRYEGGVRPSLDVVRSAFAASGHKPEELHKALSALEFRFDLTADTVDAAFREAIARQMAELRQGFMRQVNGLPPLQAAVLIVMARTGIAFAPFSKHTAKMYEEVCAKITDSATTIDVSAIQYALEALREKQLVWKSARGVYAVEEAQNVAWLNEES